MLLQMLLTEKQIFINEWIILCLHLVLHVIVGSCFSKDILRQNGENVMEIYPYVSFTGHQILLSVLKIGNLLKLSWLPSFSGFIVCELVSPAFFLFFLPNLCITLGIFPEVSVPQLVFLKTIISSRLSSCWHVMCAKNYRIFW